MSSQSPYRLFADYFSDPVWCRVDTGFMEKRETRSLPISRGLADAIVAWNDLFKQTYDSSYPPDSAFASPEEEALFNERGYELARRLSEELGGSVEYDDMVSGEIVEIGCQRG